MKVLANHPTISSFLRSLESSFDCYQKPSLGYELRLCGSSSAITAQQHCHATSRMLLHPLEPFACRSYAAHCPCGHSASSKYSGKTSTVHAPMLDPGFKSGIVCEHVNYMACRVSRGT